MNPEGWASPDDAGMPEDEETAEDNGPEADDEDDDE
jgi:hypothetical protein